MNKLEEELLLGIEAQMNQQLETAHDHYTTVLEAEPSHPDANHAFGLLLVEKRNWRAAVPYLHSALEGRPQAQHLWFDCLDAMIGAELWLEANDLIAKARRFGLSSEELDIRELLALTGMTHDSLQGEDEVLTLVT